MEVKNIVLKQPKEYEIDFTKVKTIEDVTVILKAMNIKVYDNYEEFETFKPYLKGIE